MHNKKFLITVSSYDANPIILSVPLPHFCCRIKDMDGDNWTITDDDVLLKSQNTFLAFVETT